MMLYISVSMLIMFLSSFIMIDTMRTAGMDVTVEHLIRMMSLVLLAPITLPMVLFIEFANINIDKVVFKKKGT